jgi:hypothetical protein
VWAHPPQALSGHPGPQPLRMSPARCSFDNRSVRSMLVLEPSQPSFHVRRTNLATFARRSRASLLNTLSWYVSNGQSNHRRHAAGSIRTRSVYSVPALRSSRMPGLAPLMPYCFGDNRTPISSILAQYLLLVSRIPLEPSSIARPRHFDCSRHP